MDDNETRVHVKRNSRKKTGYEVELRSDGFFYVKSVPSKKSKIKPGDRVLEINGVKHTDFKTAASANRLIDMLVLDVREQIRDSEDEDHSIAESSASQSYQTYDTYGTEAT